MVGVTQNKRRWGIINDLMAGLIRQMQCETNQHKCLRLTVFVSIQSSADCRLINSRTLTDFYSSNPFPFNFGSPFDSFFKGVNIIIRKCVAIS